MNTSPKILTESALKSRGYARLEQTMFVNGELYRKLYKKPVWYRVEVKKK